MLTDRQMLALMDKRWSWLLRRVLVSVAWVVGLVVFVGLEFRYGSSLWWALPPGLASMMWASVLVSWLDTFMRFARFRTRIRDVVYSSGRDLDASFALWRSFNSVWSIGADGGVPLVRDPPLPDDPDDSVDDVDDEDDDEGGDGTSGLVGA